MKYKIIYILSILFCFLLYILEQVLQVNYLIKTLSKLIMFITVPVIYLKLVKKSKLKDALNIKRISNKDVKLGLFFGFLSFFIVVLAYIALKNQIDFDNITVELRQLNITATNFILIGIYITFVNSLLEEFFFRGFIFLNLYEYNKKSAYLFSSLLFSIYHIAIFKTWFNSEYIILAIIGLTSIGLLFNYLDLKANNFLNSWIVHILADAAIILIGFRLFQII